MGVYAAVDTSREWHPANSIVLKIDGTDRTLQYALTNNLLTGAHTYAAPSSIPIGNHSAENIWVYTDSVKTLLVALQSSSYGLCRTSASPSYSESGVGHTAREVKADSANSFQEAIDSGAFCCAPKTCADYPSQYGTALDNGCGGTIACCVPNYEQSCGGSICINPGTIACDGTCTGTSNKEVGTPCGDGRVCSPHGYCCVPNYGQACDDGNPCGSGETIQCDGSCIGYTSAAPRGTSCETNKICDGIGNCIFNVGGACYPENVDASCTNAGTIQADGSCAGYSFIVRGTNCNAEGTQACDGGGHCQGWSGSDCSTCPFGIYTSGKTQYCDTVDVINEYMAKTTYNPICADGYTNWGRSYVNGLCAIEYCCRRFIICLEWCYDYYGWKMKPYGTGSIFGC